jgi:hypothetical protein
MTNPVTIALDRTLRVPAGCTVVSGAVSVWKVRHACRVRMAVGDVGASYQKILQLGSDHYWPGPWGEWDGDEFILYDGRHQHVAEIMLGREYMLVCWIQHTAEVGRFAPARAA